jgi:hypothetical protein
VVFLIQSLEDLRNFGQLFVREADIGFDSDIGDESNGLFLNPELLWNACCMSKLM